MSKIAFLAPDAPVREIVAAEWLTKPNHRVATNFAQGMYYLRLGHDVLFDINGFNGHELSIIDTEAAREMLGTQLIAELELDSGIKVGSLVRVKSQTCRPETHPPHEVTEIDGEFAIFKSGSGWPIHSLIAVTE